jgi:hypothetical protein
MFRQSAAYHLRKKNQSLAERQKRKEMVKRNKVSSLYASKKSFFNHHSESDALDTISSHSSPYVPSTPIIATNSVMTHAVNYKNTVEPLLTHRVNPS